MNTEAAWKAFVDRYVYIPFLSSALVLGLFLLFYRDLDPAVRSGLVAALAIYVIGASLIGYVYHDLDARNCVRAGAEQRPPLPQPLWISALVWFAHIAWFGLLVIYLFGKHVV